MSVWVYIPDVTTCQVPDREDLTWGRVLPERDMACFSKLVSTSPVSVVSPSPSLLGSVSSKTVVSTSVCKLV